MDYINGTEVRVNACYLQDEVNDGYREKTSEFAIIVDEPNDNEQLVGIQYKSGMIDYVSHDWLEIM
jgi:hypothetical protein